MKRTWKVLIFTTSLLVFMTYQDAMAEKAYVDLLVRLAKLEKTAEKQAKIEKAHGGETGNLAKQLEDIRRGMAKGVSRNQIERKLSAAEWFQKAYDHNAQMREKEGKKHQYLDEVIRLYTKAIEIDPGFAVAYLNRGITYRKKGDYDQAILDSSKAIEIDPGMPRHILTGESLTGKKAITTRQSGIAPKP